MLPYFHGHLQAHWSYRYPGYLPQPQWNGYHVQYSQYSNEQKGSCFDYGFCSEEHQNQAYDAMLSRLREEGTLSHIAPDCGRLRINVPFAGKFAERNQLMAFLRMEVLDKRPDVNEIHIFVTDVNDFYCSTESSPDPQIFLHYAVQDGRAKLPPADLVLGMHPDCSSSFLTSFWGYYKAYYFMWQDILHSALSSAPLAVFANLWLEESIEVQKVARHQGMVVSPAIKNRLYYGKTYTAPLTSNLRDRQPFHYLVIAQRHPADAASGIEARAEDYTGPYQNQWTMYPPATHQAWAPHSAVPCGYAPHLTGVDYWNSRAFVHPTCYPPNHQGPVLNTTCY